MVVGVLILGALMGYAWNLNVSSQVDAQRVRNSLLQEGIDRLNSEVTEIRDLQEKKADMIDRMEVIKGLQTNRDWFVNL